MVFFWSRINQLVKGRSQAILAENAWSTVAILAVVLLVGSTSSAHGQPTGSEGSYVHVAVMADPGPSADSLTAQIRREVEALLGTEHTLRSTVTDGTASWTREDAAAAHRKASTAAADVIVAIGPVAMAGACQRVDGPTRPLTIAVSTGSGVLAPTVDATHCTTVGPVGWPAASLRAFQRLSRFETLTVVADGRVTDSMPEAPRRVQARGKEGGVQAALVPLRDVEATVEAVTERTPDAVFLDHVDRFDSRTVERLADALTDRRIPVFAHDATYAERHGALAAPDRVRRLRARHAALAVETILEDTLATARRTLGSSPVGTDPGLVVNRRTAHDLGVSLGWDLQVDARLVGTRAPETRPTTLAQSMRESIASNLTLKAERERVSAQANEVDVARSDLLPQVRASATGRRVSEDLASASLGSQPEELLSSAVSVRQVIFNEPAFAELSVERRMQAMREFERQSVRLDAAKRAADAYLGVLQARARVKIRRENVQSVRANLQAAQVREQVGAADPREVSRLETQLAQAESGLLQALGNRDAAEIQYNRVLNRPLDAPVVLRDSTGVDPAPIVQQFPYTDTLTASGQATDFRRFWVVEARNHAPEVQAIDRLVSARKRQLTSVERSFWMPTLSVEGSFSQRLYEGGTGTSGVDLSLPQGNDFSIPTPPDQQWSLGVTASFPLFSGAERAARHRQASDQLAASRTEHMMAKLGVEQKARTALVELETAHARVQRALCAAEAARRTLDVTEAAYRQGRATVVDLVDAQNAALTTRLDASNAAYDLLRDWITVQRAAGSFRALRTPEEQQDFEERLSAVMNGTDTR